MSEAKKELIRLIKQQPSDSTMQEVVGELAAYRVVKQSLQNMKPGGGVSCDEVARRIREWFDEAQSQSQQEARNVGGQAGIDTAD